MNYLIAAASVAMAGAISVSPVNAQKSKDTVFLGITAPFHTLDTYHVPANEPGQYTRNMYGKLIVYDEHKGKFVPELAKSWKRIDDKTIEFELRDDVRFTSGNKFTAADVKYTLDYIGHPKLKIRFKRRYNWVKETQILSRTRIRIVSKKVRADAMMVIAYRFYIYDKGVHEKLENKALYGAKSGSTTGVWKLLSIDKNKGVHLVRNDEAVKKFPHRRAPIKFIRGIPIPDRQTQLAALLTGKIHSLRNPTADMVKQLRKNPDIRVSAFPTRNLTYMTFDSAGRSKNKIFMDKRVRQAFMKAVPRETLVKSFVAGADIAKRPNAICYVEVVACSFTSNPVGYDPAGAKKLLAEAGHPNGIDFELTVYPQYAELATAVAGELRKVGIRARVRPQPLASAGKRRGRGELTVLMAGYPTFAQPNTSNLMNFFFSGNRDYSRDPIIQKARKIGITVIDLEKRKEIYRKALNRVNEESYIFPFVETPNVYAHSKNVNIKIGATSMTETRPSDYFWR